MNGAMPTAYKPLRSKVASASTLSTAAFAVMDDLTAAAVDALSLEGTD
jgi:hypothetical protein